MFLSASIDSGIGLTAGKKLVGKTIPQSDDTYLSNVQLHEKFIQLKKYLAIRQKVKPGNHERIEELRKAVLKLQEDINTYKTVAETVTKENRNLAVHMAKLQPLVEFVNSFDAPENLKRILDFLKDGLTDSMYDSLRALVEESLEMHAKEDYKKQKKKRSKARRSRE